MSTGSSLAIRALGPYGGSAPGYRLTTFLVDGESALDAGALTDALPLSAQRRIRRVFLTHAHFGAVTFTPIRVSHVVPAYGYLVSKPGRSVLFSGDTEPTEELWRVARRARNLKAIFLELSFSDTQIAVAQASRHLTPSLVREEIAKAPAGVPVFLYHMKPPSLTRIRREIAAAGDPRLRLLDSERGFRF